jgi:DNA polymerase I-like protein with 3'-5' exonuclease and polymerase domains
MELPNYKRANALVIDLETYDPNIDKFGPGWATGDGGVIGYGVGVLGDHSHTRYISVGHNGFKNTFTPEQGRAWFQEIMALPIPKIYFNGPYDMGWTKREGVKINGSCYCAMEAAALIDERRPSYSLENVGRWLVGQGKVVSVLEQYAGDRGLNSKSDMYRMDPAIVGEYCCGDVNLTGDVWLKEEPLLHKDDLWKIFLLESGLLPLWVEMRWQGVPINEGRVAELQSDFAKRSEEISTKLSKDYGVKVDLWKARDIERLCISEKIQFKRTKGTAKNPDGNPSFQKDWLETHPHPAMNAIAMGRKYAKVATTFLEGLTRYCHNGRVHPEIHAMKSDDGGTVTGRLSVSHPGLHQMPGERSGMEMARAIRGLFITADPKKLLSSNDYSQQEPRLQIHYASVLKLRGAENAVRTFKENPRTDYHQWSAETFDAPRKEAKIINLGLAYGMGTLKLAFSLGITFDEAKEKLDRYYTGMPWMRELQRTCANKAADRGYIKTILGRRCRYEDWEPVDRAILKRDGGPSTPLPRVLALESWPNTPLRRSWTYRGMNGLIQGSAADQTKKAMRDLYYEHGIIPYLQMHDELLTEVEDEEQANLIAKVMENAVKLAVPVIVDTKTGHTWGECLGD